ncbi:hypothetical protein Godav_021708, partial [Gossypium davidsonii]|nr:hypothetical protein [Gossypium davidsonii]
MQILIDLRYAIPPLVNVIYFLILHQLPPPYLSSLPSIAQHNHEIPAQAPPPPPQ